MTDGWLSGFQKIHKLLKEENRIEKKNRMESGNMKNVVQSVIVIQTAMIEVRDS